MPRDGSEERVSQQEMTAESKLSNKKEKRWKGRNLSLLPHVVRAQHIRAEMLFRAHEDLPREIHKPFCRHGVHHASDPLHHPAKKTSKIKNCVTKDWTYDISKEAHRKASENHDVDILIDRHLIDGLTFSTVDSQNVIPRTSSPWDVATLHHTCQRDRWVSAVNRNWGGVAARGRCWRFIDWEGNTNS